MFWVIDMQTGLLVFLLGRTLKKCCSFESCWDIEESGPCHCPLAELDDGQLRVEVGN